VDAYTGIDYEHRRGWIAGRLKELSSIFGMEVFAYAVMSNHSHIVMRNRPDLAKGWTPEEVAYRWCTLFPKRDAHGVAQTPNNEAISAFIADAERVETCRERLGDISWFMRCLNEPIARRANREDQCSGRFWEGRFKCQRLMDEGAMLACMAYVDLNPVRAQLSDSLEDSKFTSVYDRLTAERAQKRLKVAGRVLNPTQAQQALIERERVACKRADWLLDLNGSESPFGELDLEYYLSLVEWTGQNIRQDKPGYLPVSLKPVLERFALDTENWVRNVEGYGGLFYRVAGQLDSIMTRARARGQHWLRGRSGSEQLYCEQRTTA
jgi:REP element-mobilizing transposase RayT